ncbi:unnamed protein product [Cyclocybe aegerita]|uniref:CAP-Gly domain-containing protein n=1 Tax=Cyclocybe aegerita TaxID=1973307 RepID=A0A8S0W6M1_CYCAE|nr:unnamed protein product [Cyclocybe aegerita]
MTTPARPRQSAIPGPGRLTGIPTPGRSRSSSSVYQTTPITAPNDIERAFHDAVKANDPSHHRTGFPPTLPSSSSLSPQSISHSLSSGRRSVAGRPSSSASTSSVKVTERAKTPTSARTSSRPPSRQSDAATRLPRSFEVGDNVRIESLGFEGTLRYLGEIDGKPGLWAGVELSGGFAGKGKNNGSVAGQQYFVCPDKCGVFVATTKLSAPTVGPGAVQRPPSVASSRGGRTTPANSGRITPSFLSRTPSASLSNGRVTPVTSGRVTPSSSIGRMTPGNLPTARRTFKTPTSKPNGATLSDKITAGSRASKYMTMTAQQLNSRDLNSRVESPTRKSHENGGFMLSSPTISRSLSSPSRSTGSPFSTPRPINGRPSVIGGITASPSLPSTRSRPSMNTPRPRVPSAVAMPPPPSPKTSAIQPDKSLPDAAATTSRPSSSASFRSVGTDELNLIEQLQSRLEAAEYENERLRSATSEPDMTSTYTAELEQLRLEFQESVDQKSSLQERFSLLQLELSSNNTRLESLQAENSRLTVQVTDAQSEIQRFEEDRLQEQQKHLLDLESLQDKLEQIDSLVLQKDATIESQAKDVERLTSDISHLRADLEEERKELGAQIDELRIAGQETIALYEERLSDSNTRRYEFEQRVTALEASLEAATKGDHSQEQASRATSAATQIDNESLRDQVQHLQRRSNKLEEQLEDARAALERDVAAYQDKIARIRLEDDQRKRDLALKTREVEQLLKSEANARGRIEEIEEALRESTVALENARGEVETLRAELDNLDVLIDDASEGDIASRLANFMKKASVDKARLQQEIVRLEDLVQNLRAENKRVQDQPTANLSNVHASLQETIDSLKAQNAQLHGQIAGLNSKVSELTQSLNDQNNEMDGLRKKLNREALVNGTSEPKAVSPKSESSTVREEVAGLKHIVQELQKENLAAAQQIKLLESENLLLTAETEQLRQEVRILEDNLDDSIHLGASTMDSPPSNSNEVDGQHRKMKEQTSRLESELEQMRKRLNEAEMKHARATHDLNKEISELEALVESKIYREDELEQEVERLKEKLSRHKKSSKGANESQDGRHRLSNASISTTSSEKRVVESREEVCEICERPGHDIFNCSLLKDDVGTGLVCEDCESPGHVAANCPHSQDVF